MREGSDGMREILFRGKNIVTGEWVYGYLVEGTDGIYNTPITVIFPVDAPLYSYGGTGGWVKVDPESVDQYTGLDDANGQKIFEGDIVKWVLDGDETYWYEMGFYEGSFAYREICCKGNDLCWYSVFDSENRLLNEEVRIVGNIFDNPGLLDRKED